jgi:hypothetical protein
MAWQPYMKKKPAKRRPSNPRGSHGRKLRDEVLEHFYAEPVRALHRSAYSLFGPAPYFRRVVDGHLDEVLLLPIDESGEAHEFVLHNTVWQFLQVKQVGGVVLIESEEAQSWFNEAFELRTAIKAVDYYLSALSSFFSTSVPEQFMSTSVADYFKANKLFPLLPTKYAGEQGEFTPKPKEAEHLRTTQARCEPYLKERIVEMTIFGE